MERPDRPVTTQPEEGWPSSAVALQRQQRRAKRVIERIALFVIAGPVCLALFAFLIFWLGSASGWALLGLPLIGGGGAWIWAVGGPGGRYRKAFKGSLIPRLLAAHGELVHNLGAKPDLSRAVALALLLA